MCLAIYKPEKAEVPKKWLKNGFNGNDDGAGFAYAENGEVKILKGFFTFGEFWKAYKGHAKKPCVIHFRMATHGTINPDNCHPFPLQDGKYALVHNGIINIQSTEEKSDTAHFAELVLDPMLRQGVKPACPAFKYLVEQTIGTHNKLAILQGDGQAVIFNEKAGVWRNGAWYSNTGFDYEPLDREWFRAGNGKWLKEYHRKERFPDYEYDYNRERLQWNEQQAEAEYYRTMGMDLDK